MKDEDYIGYSMEMYSMTPDQIAALLKRTCGQYAKRL